MFSHEVHRHEAAGLNSIWDLLDDLRKSLKGSLSTSVMRIQHGSNGLGVAFFFGLETVDTSMSLLHADHAPFLSHSYAPPIIKNDSEQRLVDIGIAKHEPLHLGVMEGWQ